MPEEIKVVLIDDHPLIIAGIKAGFAGRADIKIVGEAYNGKDGIEMVERLAPHVVIMDINMEEGSGLEATREILHRNPRQKILILTVCIATVFPRTLLKAGVSGYITKESCTIEELANAIHAVYAGQYYISSGLAQRLALSNISRTTEEEVPFHSLSDRELQVTLLIAKGKRPDEIASLLFLSPKTVNTYRYRIFTKLKNHNITNDTQLALLAWEHGIVNNADRGGSGPKDSQLETVETVE